MSITKEWKVAEEGAFSTPSVRIGKEWILLNSRKDALLIAAAPELLGALQNAVDKIRCQLLLLKCDDEFIEKETEDAHAAIKKALGE